MFPNTGYLNNLLRTDSELRALSQNTDVCFQLGDGPKRTLTVVSRAGETLVKVDRVTDTPDFKIVLDTDDWKALFASVPAPRKQHLLAFLAPRGTGTVQGNQESFAQHLQLVRRFIEVASDRRTEESTPKVPVLDAITGRYVRVNVEAWGDCDIYYESAGHGQPVVLLATAGSDNRQYHGLLSDPTLTSKYQLIAPDLPWHGKSSPSPSAGPTGYRLTTKSYTDCVANFISALNLQDKAVLVGASMAGAAVIEMAALHPHMLHGVVSSQAGPRIANRMSPWLQHPKINQTLHVPEWTYGLMSPTSPKISRDEVWWGYSQGGAGVYAQDIEYYSQCWDIDNIAHLFNESTPPTVLMNGIYDYSVPPEATRELVSRIPRAVYREMPELGHFPHAENPPAFSRHLHWALETISAAHAKRQD